MRTASVLDGDCLFDSMHSALMFAFRYNGQQYSPSLMATMMRGPIVSGMGLSGLDGAAQAGIIRGILAHNLDIYAQHMIAARYASNEREAICARLALVPVVIAAMPTGAHSRRAADALVQKWMGKRIPIKLVAEIVGLKPDSLTPAWHIVKKTLTNINDRAEGAAYRVLSGIGIIPA